MVCPCRVVLAGLSAFVAVFLIWHVKTSSVSQQDLSVQQVIIDCESSLFEEVCIQGLSICTLQAPSSGHKPNVKRDRLQPALEWKFVLSLFTGKYLWDASTIYREQRRKDSAQSPG